jgi:hypothetical protein
MGNIIQYQVVIYHTDKSRVTYPALDEAWDDLDEARRIFDHYVSECRQQRCKTVSLIEINEDEGNKAIDHFSRPKGSTPQ